jgi:hypothetical protein
MPFLFKKMAVEDFSFICRGSLQITCGVMSAMPCCAGKDLLICFFCNLIQFREKKKSSARVTEHARTVAAASGRENGKKRRGFQVHSRGEDGDSGTTRAMSEQRTASVSSSRLACSDPGMIDHDRSIYG